MAPASRPPHRARTLAPTLLGALVILTLVAVLIPWDELEDRAGAPVSGQGEAQQAMPLPAPTPQTAQQDAPDADGRAAPSLPDPAGGAPDAALGERRALSARLEVRVRGPDGAPVPGMVLALKETARWAVPDDWLRATTDGGGLARFPQAAPGLATVFPQLGGGREVHVAPEGVTTLELQLPSLGRTLHGVVQDDEGAPVPGAHIWCAVAALDKEQGGMLARSDQDGRFTLGYVGEQHMLAAAADGFVPSWKLPWEDWPQTSSGALRIELARGGNTVDVLVVGEDGQPMAGMPVRTLSTAYLSNLTNLDRHRSRPRGLTTERFTRAVLTDAEGRARLGGLPGDHDLVMVVLRARGFAKTTAYVLFGSDGKPQTLAGGDYPSPVDLPGDGQTLRMVLHAEARLEGRVTDQGGRPVAGASIASIPHMPSADSDDVALTDADGRYALRGLQAWGGTPRPFYVDHPTYRAAEQELLLASGQTTTWDVVLERGGMIGGTVRHPQGRPFEGAWLVASTEGWTGSAETDAEGRFLLGGMPGQSHPYVPGWPNPVRLAVYEDRQATAAWPSLERLISQTTLDLELVLARGMVRGAITGNVVDVSGAPLASSLDLTWLESIDPAATDAVAPIEKARERRALQATTDAHSGAFRLAPVRAGVMELVVQVTGRPKLTLPVRYPDVSQPLDLGDVVVPAGGTLVVTPRVSGGLPSDGKLSITLRRPDGSRARSMHTPPDSVATFVLPAGEYWLCLNDRDFAAHLRTVTLVEGERQELTLDAVAAPSVWIEADKPAEPFEVLQALRIRRHGGELVYATHWTGQSRLRYPLGLAPGPYEWLLGDGLWQPFDVVHDDQTLRLTPPP